MNDFLLAAIYIMCRVMSLKRRRGILKVRSNSFSEYHSQCDTSQVLYGDFTTANVTAGRIGINKIGTIGIQDNRYVSELDSRHDEDKCKSII